MGEEVRVVKEMANPGSVGGIVATLADLMEVFGASFAQESLNLFVVSYWLATRPIQAVDKNDHAEKALDKFFNLGFNEAPAEIRAHRLNLMRAITEMEKDEQLADGLRCLVAKSAMLANRVGIMMDCITAVRGIAAVLRDENMDEASKIKAIQNLSAEHSALINGLKDKENEE